MRDWTQSCDASVAARSSGQSQAFEEKRGGGRGGEKRLEGGGRGANRVHKHGTKGMSKREKRHSVSL